MLLISRVTNYTLLIILQKDISGDSEDESDNERQSDVSTPSY